jgi:hypothetical protein
MSLRIRRGTNAQRTSITFDLGEIVYTTDTQKLYIGDGITAGGKHVLETSAGNGFTFNPTTQRIDFSIGNLNLTTAQVTEDPSKLYFTNARVIAALPSQSGNNGKLLSTDGAGNLSWTPPTSGDRITNNGLSVIINALGNVSVPGDIALANNDLTTTGAVYTGSLTATGTVTAGTFTTTGTVNTNNIQATGTMNCSSVTASTSLNALQVKVSTDTYDSNSTLFVSSQYHNTPSIVNNYVINRGRGTSTNRLAVQNGDDIGQITFYGYDGTSLIGVGGINIEVAATGTISTGAIPCIMRFTLHNGVSRATRAEISGTSSVNTVLKVNNLSGYTRNYIGFAGMPVLPTYAGDAAAIAANGGTAIAGMMYVDSNTGKIRGYSGGVWAPLN